jgi:Domain of unknown function (DUF4450)
MAYRGRPFLLSLLFCSGLSGGVVSHAQANPQSAAIAATAGLHPNLAGQVARPLRYRPVDGDFVIENGPEFFNRSLYGGNTAFRVDGGDKPEFVMYLPGRGGNLRLGIRAGGTAKWLKDADAVVTRYRPGELIYEIRDKTFGANAVVTVEALAYAVTEGLIVRVQAKNIAGGAELIWAYGGVNGQRGSRDGDIGTERVPISEWFQFQPGFADDNTFTLGGEGFMLKSSHANIVGVTPASARLHVADVDSWNDLPALLAEGASAPRHGVMVGVAPLTEGAPLLLSLQRVGDGSSATPDLNVYQEVTTRAAGKSAPAKASSLPPAFARVTLPEEFAVTQKHFDELRNKVRIDTPDPYLNAAMGALNVVSDALWDTDAQAIMHGAIAWRTKLLGWRGPYSLDALGWHDRARENFATWLPHQNTTPIGAIPAADPKANLSRNEPGLHTNGDLSNSHYDMNMVFIDALFRHLLWTGDKNFARTAWPVVQRHIAWERRLFRREYGPQKLPLYEAYATIWASDDLYYDGGGSAYASAYNVYANRMAARMATMLGDDPKPYTNEADLIEKAMWTYLWMPERGTFAEYKDVLGQQLVHADYGLWNFYHTVDEQAVTPREAWQMGTDLTRHMKAIPVEGAGVPADQPYHVYAETDWMPYSWSINNVVMDENMHTALALWEGEHSQDAYVLAKGAILASMYMGISPGNVGTMQYLDAYRRESQRDFGDSAGAMSRAIVEGLFGIHPDALAGTLTVAPGFPGDWMHARLSHPDVGVDFVRKGRVDAWTITQSGRLYQTLKLRVPAAFTGVSQVEVNGAKARWRSYADAVGRPVLEIVTRSGTDMRVEITWSGAVVDAHSEAAAKAVGTDGDFKKMSLGAFTWWAVTPKARNDDVAAAKVFDWHVDRSNAHFDSVAMTSAFNDRVSAIFAPGKYLSPRSSGVSLALPSQGAGAWAGHMTTLPVIDDSGLRRVAAANGGTVAMPNGIRFTTPSEAEAKNIAFTSQWDNYPREVTVPLNGRARQVYLLMAGSTNFMQSRMDNGEVLVAYSDGTSARLALRNPETWWPIEQDYFVDDYQFPLEGTLPPRVDLKTGTVRLLDAATFKGKGREIPGGAATVLHLALDPAKQLQSLTVRTLANDVVIGLMSATLERP